MLKANVECQSGATNGLHVAGQAAYDCPGGSYGRPLTPYGCSPHMVAQRLLLGALGAAYGSSVAPNGCPWDPHGRSEAELECSWGCIRPLKGSIWLPMGLYMVAKRLHLTAERVHFVAQGPSMAPMRQICSIHPCEKSLFQFGRGATSDKQDL